MPFARLHYTATIVRPLRLPEFAGSTLRGVFGRALRRLACGGAHAPGCPADCGYRVVFEPTSGPDGGAADRYARQPVPFVIEPPPWGAQALEPGQTLQFAQVLIGPALAHRGLIIAAWQQALAGGLGAGDGTAHLDTVQVEDADLPVRRTLWSAQAAGALDPLTPPRLALAVPPEHELELTLRFSTPLRLAHNAQAVSVQRLTERELLLALWRRARLLLGEACPSPAVELSTLFDRIRGDKQLKWRDWTRRSSRQQATMTLGGAVGDWGLRGPLGPFLPYLHLGQWLHVGKNASFGMGQYRLLRGTEPEHPA